MKRIPHLKTFHKRVFLGVLLGLWIVIFTNQFVGLVLNGAFLKHHHISMSAYNNFNSFWSSIGLLFAPYYNFDADSYLTNVYIITRTLMILGEMIVIILISYGLNNPSSKAHKCLGFVMIIVILSLVHVLIAVAWLILFIVLSLTAIATAFWPKRKLIIKKNSLPEMKKEVL